jgi:hypothetical protein
MDDDLLESLLGGAQESSAKASADKDLVGGLLEAMMGGQQGSAPSEEPLGGLLEAIMGGEPGGTGGLPGMSGQGAPGGDPLGGLLEGMLGGGPGGAGSMPGISEQAGLGGGLLGGLLQGILGGGGGSAGGLGGLLEGVLGGASPGGMGGSSSLAPFTEALSEKLGISPQLASVLITFALGLLTSSLRGSSRGGQASPESLDLDQLLDDEALRASGLTQQLSAQTGLSEQEAMADLREAVYLLAGQQSPPTGAAPASPREAKPAKPPTSAAGAKQNQKPAPKRKKGKPVADADLTHVLDEW